MGIQLSDRVKNIVAKREIARYEQFLLIPQCFQMLSILVRQNEYLWNKGLKLAHPVTSLKQTLICFFHSINEISNEIEQQGSKLSNTIIKKISVEYSESYFLFGGFLKFKEKAIDVFLAKKCTAF